VTKRFGLVKQPGIRGISHYIAEVINDLIDMKMKLGIKNGLKIHMYP
jgi:hypothetical protein